MSSRLIALLVALIAAGCGSDDRFPCGTHGGSCALGSQICVVSGPDSCSTCVAAPPAYVDSPSCESLPPASDEAFSTGRCIDDGACSEVEGGAVVTCAEATWFCG